MDSHPAQLDLRSAHVTPVDVREDQDGWTGLRDRASGRRSGAARRRWHLWLRPSRWPGQRLGHEPREQLSDCHAVGDGPTSYLVPQPLIQPDPGRYLSQARLTLSIPRPSLGPCQEQCPADKRGLASTRRPHRQFSAASQLDYSRRGKRGQRRRAGHHRSFGSGRVAAGRVPSVESGTSAPSAWLSPQGEVAGCPPRTDGVRGEGRWSERGIRCLSSRIPGIVRASTS